MSTCNNHVVSFKRLLISCLSRLAADDSTTAKAGRGDELSRDESPTHAIANEPANVDSFPHRIEAVRNGERN